MLGPLAMALFVILRGSEEQRKDRIHSGIELGINGSLGLYAGSLLVYRALRLDDQQVQDWRTLLGQQKISKECFSLPTMTIFYQQLQQSIAGALP